MQPVNWMQDHTAIRQGEEGTMRGSFLKAKILCFQGEVFRLLQSDCLLDHHERRIRPHLAARLRKRRRLQPLPLGLWIQVRPSRNKGTLDWMGPGDNSSILMSRYLNLSAENGETEVQSKSLAQSHTIKETVKI